MSAFIVSKSHIDAICAAARTYPPYGVTWRVADGPWKKLNKGDTLDSIGQMLWHENLVSVSYTYADDDPDDLPGPIGLGVSTILSYKYRPPTQMPTPLEALKLLHCYRYQSSEHDEWESSEANAFVESLIDDLIHALPGYDKAPWSWDETEEPAPVPSISMDIRLTCTVCHKSLTGDPGDTVQHTSGGGHTVGPAKKPVANTEQPANYDRDTVMAFIRAQLKKRSGKSWSVTGGKKGTAWGWIEIDAPPARRCYDWDGTTYTGPGGHSSLEDRQALTKLLGLEKEMHPQGISIAASHDYRQEYCDRAAGRVPSTTGTPYWD